MIQPDNLRSAFPNRELPATVEKILSYQNSVGELLGEFRIDDQVQYTLDDLSKKNRFAAFGSDATGGAYAFWSGTDKPIAAEDLTNSPIVFLDSEAVYSTVVSLAIDDFVRLLVVGVEDIGKDAAMNEIELPAAPAKKVVRFRQWVASNLGIDVPSNAVDLVLAAKSQYHEPFTAWYRDWQGADPWTKPAE